MADYPWPNDLPAPFDCQFVDDPRRARHSGVLTGVDNFVDLGGDTLRMQTRFRFTEEQRRLYTGFISRFRGADRLELRDYQHPGNSHPEAFSGGRILRARGARAADARTIVTDGWPASSEILRAGDQFSINNWLYLVTDTVNTSAAGVATIPVFPAVPASGIADNALLDLTQPVGTWLIESRSPVAAAVGQLYVVELMLKQDVAAA